MSASQDFVVLDWIKADISETLTKAQQSLEAVAEQGEDPSSMRARLTALHQVHGTLKMVEIEGPVLVAGEMEALVQALMNDQVPDVGHAQELDANNPANARIFRSCSARATRQSSICSPYC